MREINIIVAKSKNNAIGGDNKLLWSLPSDLKFFKQKTTNNVIVMGRTTYESIGRPLPNRINVVLSRKIEKTYKDENGVYFCNNLIDLANYLERIDYNGDVFICGGGEIYKQTIDKVDNMYITEIDEEFEGDTYFPEFDESEWNKKLLDEKEENGLKFNIYKYGRKNKK